MFVGIDSVNDMVVKITNAQREEIDEVIHEGYADYSSSDDEDMGFSPLQVTVLWLNKSDFRVVKFFYFIKLSCSVSTVWYCSFI